MKKNIVNRHCGDNEIQCCEIIGDGNCVYRSLAHQLSLIEPGCFDTDEEIRRLRGLCYTFIKDNIEDFENTLAVNSIDSGFNSNSFRGC